MTDRELDQGALDAACDVYLMDGRAVELEAVICAYLDNGGEQAIRDQVIAEQPPRGDSPPDYCPPMVEAEIRASERARLKEKLGSRDARRAVAKAAAPYVEDFRGLRARSPEEDCADAALAAVVRLLEDEDG